MSDPLNFLDTGLGTPVDPNPTLVPPPPADTPDTHETPETTAPAPAPAEPATPAVPARLHPDDLQAIITAAVAAANSAPRPAAPGEAPAPVPKAIKRGELVSYRSTGHYGTQEQFGVALEDTDEYGRVRVAWFAGRSGAMPTADLEPFELED